MKTKIRYNKKISADIPYLSIPIDLYKCEICVFFQNNNDKLNKCNEWKLPDGVEAGVQNYLDEGEVWLRFKKTPTVSTITHEVNHIVTVIMLSRGHVLDKEVDEPTAYLSGYIMEKILELAKKHKIRVSLR